MGLRSVGAVSISLIVLFIDNSEMDYLKLVSVRHLESSVIEACHLIVMPSGLAGYKKPCLRLHMGFPIMRYSLRTPVIPDLRENVHPK